MPWNSVLHTPPYATEAGTLKIEADLTMRLPSNEELMDEDNNSDNSEQGLDEVLMETSTMVIETSDMGESVDQQQAPGDGITETPKSSRAKRGPHRSHSLAKKSPLKSINKNDGRRWINKLTKTGKNSDQPPITLFMRPRTTPNTSTSTTPNPGPSTTPTMARSSTSTPPATSNNNSNSNASKTPQKRKGTPVASETRQAKSSKSTARKKNNNNNNNNKTKNNKNQPPPRRRRHLSSENESDSQMETSSDSGDTESYDDDEEEEGTTRNCIPTMSIHRIIVEKLVKDPENFRPNRIRNQYEGSTVEEQALLNIMKNHRHRQQQNQNLKQELFVPYEEKSITISNPKKKAYFKDTPVEDFKARLYVQVTEHRDRLLSFYDSRDTRRSVHKVWFFYRAGDLFALTTGQAWSVVHEYADFTFPTKIANRLGSEDGPKSLEGKVLAGNTVNTKITNKDPHANTPNDVPVLPSRYKFELRLNASIFLYKCFEAESKGKKKKVTFIECGVSYIRFSKSFEIFDYPLILHHLSIIHNDKPTYKHFSPDDTNENEDRPVQDQTTLLINNNNNDDDNNLNLTFDLPPTPRAGSSSPSISSSQESLLDSQASTVNANSTNGIPEKDTNVYNTYFTKVQKETQLELQTKLAELFEKAVNLNNGNKPSELLESFNLSHKYIGDFAHASSFVLRNKGVKINNNNNNNNGENNHNGFPCLPVNPTLTDVVNIISKNPNGYFRNLHNYDNSNGYERYKSELQKVYIDYSNQGASKDNKTSGSLLSFIDGVILYKSNNSICEGNYYWKINNCWYTTDQSYICSVHSWAAQFFKSSRLDNNDSLLHLKWPKVTRNTTGNYQPSRRNVKKEYIQNCIRENPKCFFPGTNEKQKTGLFDLLHINEARTEMSIYFISTDFECQTRNICRNIFLCYNEIFKYTKSNSKRRIGFFKLYKQNSLKSVRELKNVEDFAKLLSKARFIYALVNTEPMRVTTGPMNNFILTPSSQQPTRNNQKISLTEESKIPSEVTVEELTKILNQLQNDNNQENQDKLTVSEISKILSNHHGQLQRENNIIGDTNSQLAEWIYEKLIHKNQETEKQYVLGNKVTTDLLYCTAETFEIHELEYLRGTRVELKTIKDKIYHGVVSKFKTKYTSMPAKLELRELAKTVNKDDDRYFYICEIEEQEEQEINAAS